MKYRIISMVLIILFSLNILSSSASAQIEYPTHNSPIFKVVLPTNVNFIIDPNKVIDENSMITSPEFSIINKSSVPVKINLSFQLSSKGGALLDVKDKKESVLDGSYNNTIWFATVFSTGIENILCMENILKTQQGDQLYQYSYGIGTKDAKNPNQVKKAKDKKASDDKKTSSEGDTQNKNDIIDEPKVDQPVTSVSGGAISIPSNENSGNPNADQEQSDMEEIHEDTVDKLTEANSPAEDAGQIQMDLEQSQSNINTVSGGAIELSSNNDIVSMPDPPEALASSTTDEESTETEGQTAAIPEEITGEQPENILGEIGDEQLEVVSVEKDSDELNISVGNDMAEVNVIGADVQSVSGAAIEMENNTNVDGETNTDSIGQPAAEVEEKESDISNAENKKNLEEDKNLEMDLNEDEISNETDIDKTEDKAGAESDTEVVADMEVEEGVPIFYQDAFRIFGTYGEIYKLDEKSSNLIVVKKEQATYSVVLEKAKVYNLLDGSITTGEVAENDRGVTSFRFIGCVNPKANWKDETVTIKIRYSFEEYTDSNVVEDGNKIILNKVVEDTADIVNQGENKSEEVKTGFNNEMLIDELTNGTIDQTAEIHKLE